MENVSFSAHGVTSALDMQSSAVSQLMSSSLVNQNSLSANNEQLRAGAMHEQGKGQNINVVG